MSTSQSESDSFHYHLWTSSIDGSEYANALYENKIDASVAFLSIAHDVTRNISGAEIKIEDVVGSFDGEGRGMYAGVPGLILVISSCSDICSSPVWN